MNPIVRTVRKWPTCWDVPTDAKVRGKFNGGRYYEMIFKSGFFKSDLDKHFARSVEPSNQQPIILPRY